MSFMVRAISSSNRNKTSLYDAAGAIQRKSKHSPRRQEAKSFDRSWWVFVGSLFTAEKASVHKFLL